jgi:hypothetical protein
MMRSPAMAGVLATGAPSAVDQRGAPVCSSNAYRRPSTDPTYTTPPATTGEPRSDPPVFARQATAPNWLPSPKGAAPPCSGPP